MPAYDSSSLADFECTRSAFSSPTCSFCPRENDFSCGCARVRITLLRAHDILVLPSPGAQKIGVRHRARFLEAENGGSRKGIAVSEVSTKSHPAIEPQQRGQHAGHCQSSDRQAPEGPHFSPSLEGPRVGSKHFLICWLSFPSKQFLKFLPSTVKQISSVV